jgi:hypothetical protein
MAHSVFHQGLDQQPQMGLGGHFFAGQAPYPFFPGRSLGEGNGLAGKEKVADDRSKDDAQQHDLEKADLAVHHRRMHARRHHPQAGADQGARQHGHHHGQEVDRRLREVKQAMGQKDASTDRKPHALGHYEVQLQAGAKIQGRNEQDNEGVEPDGQTQDFSGRQAVVVGIHGSQWLTYPPQSSIIS